MTEGAIGSLVVFGITSYAVAGLMLGVAWEWARNPLERRTSAWLTLTAPIWGLFSIPLGLVALSWWGICSVVGGVRWLWAVANFKEPAQGTKQGGPYR